MLGPNHSIVGNSVVSFTVTVHVRLYDSPAVGGPASGLIATLGIPMIKHKWRI